MEIVTGVHSIEGVNGSNAALLLGDQMAVVDTGIPGNGDAIVSYIRKLGRSPEELRWIVLTHFHYDHSGSAAELHELTGAKIVAHAAEMEQEPDGRLMLRKGSDIQPPPYWYLLLQGRVRGRRPDITQYHDTEVHETVEHGTVLPCLGGLRVIHMPGHTHGSICVMLEDQRILFLGDSVLNNRTRLSRPLMWDRSARRELNASLYNLRDLQAEIACFGHGPPLDEGVMEKIRGLTDRPYDLPTWRIALKNYNTLRRWRARTRRPGHWEGGVRR